MALPVITKNTNSSATVAYKATLTATNYFNVNIAGIQTTNLLINSGAFVTNGQAAGGTGYTIQAAATVTDDGILDLFTNTLIRGHVVVNSTGTLGLDNFTTTTFGALEYGTPGGLIILPAGEPTAVLSEIANIKNGDTIEFVGVHADGYSESGGLPNPTFTLSLGGTPLGTTAFQPNLTGSNSSAISVSSVELAPGVYNTFVVFTCFRPGTQIMTVEGEVAVENLRPGTMVQTHDRGPQRVRWVGRSDVSRRFADPIDALPIRIRAGALGENTPSRDLVVSPGHAVFVDGVLAHAGALVNGLSIVREQNVPTEFTYYHVELDSHALIISDGAASESFIDGLEDMDFVNWADRTAPEAVVEMAYPRCKSARQLPRATRERLAARAAAFLPETMAA